MLIVQKFGGSSLAGPEAVRRSASIIAEAVHSGAQVAAVLSAQGDATDELVSTAALYSSHPAPRELDMLLATGEQASVALMAMALQEMGVEAVSLTGWQAGLETDGVFGAARIRRIDPIRLRAELSAGRAALIAGFQGVTRLGDITTLGRGGSDTTAVAVAAALRADRCEIYTDVEGVYTADPRLVPAARKLPGIDIEEMLRLARMGAKVLHERSVELARRYRVPLEVRSSFSRAAGTAVQPLPLPENQGRLTAVTHSGNLVTLVGSNLRCLPEPPGEKAAAALSGEGIGLDAYLETDGYLAVQVDPARVTDALRCMHRTFLEPAEGIDASIS